MGQAYLFTSPDVKLVWDYLKGLVFEKDQRRIQVQKFGIQSEMECMSTDTVTKFFRYFLFRFVNV
jgi:hypothetical protein